MEKNQERITMQLKPLKLTPVHTDSGFQRLKSPLQTSEIIKNSFGKLKAGAFLASNQFVGLEH